MEAPQTACLAGAQNLNATPGQLCNLARRLDPGSQTNRASKPTVKVKATCTCARVGMCLRKICNVHRLLTVLIGYYDYHLMTNIWHSDYFPNSQFPMHCLACLGKILPNDNYYLMTIFLTCPEVVIISDTQCINITPLANMKPSISKVYRSFIGRSFIMGWPCRGRYIFLSPRGGSLIRMHVIWNIILNQFPIDHVNISFVIFPS